MLFLVLVLLLSPFLYDGVNLCVARWRTMAGSVRAAETPALDALGSFVSEGALRVRGLATPWIQVGRWEGSWVIGAGGACTLLGILLLGGRR